MKYPLWKNGFTLVELLVVVGIVGTLAGIILPVFIHGGLDEGVSTLQSSVLNAKTFAVTKRKQCTLSLCADYYTAPNPLPCLFTVEVVGETVKKQYRMPKYIRFWQYEVVGGATQSFTSGTKTVYFEPRGILHTQSTDAPQDIVITLKDIKTGLTTSRTIIGNTCQIEK